MPYCTNPSEARQARTRAARSGRARAGPAEGRNSRERNSVSDINLAPSLRSLSRSSFRPATTKLRGMLLSPSKGTARSTEWPRSFYFGAAFQRPARGVFCEIRPASCTSAKQKNGRAALRRGGRSTPGSGTARPGWPGSLNPVFADTHPSRSSSPKGGSANKNHRRNRSPLPYQAGPDTRPVWREDGHTIVPPDTAGIRISVPSEARQARTRAGRLARARAGPAGGGNSRER